MDNNLKGVSGENTEKETKLDESKERENDEAFWEALHKALMDSRRELLKHEFGKACKQAFDEKFGEELELLQDIDVSVSDNHKKE